MNKGLTVAITGQSGCGKSTLSRYYMSKGYPVIDCDEVAKYVRTLTECQIELADYFGYDILKEGRVDTKLLSQRAFSSRENLQKLTDITHRFIEKEIVKRRDEFFAAGHKTVFVDGAVIIGFVTEKHCDKFIVVVVDKEKQFSRIMKRDNLTPEQTGRRVKGRTPYSKLLKKADYVINNNTTVEELILQGELILRQIEKGQGV